MMSNQKFPYARKPLGPQWSKYPIKHNAIDISQGVPDGLVHLPKAKKSVLVGAKIDCASAFVGYRWDGIAKFNGWVIAAGDVVHYETYANRPRRAQKRSDPDGKVKLLRTYIWRYVSHQYSSTLTQRQVRLAVAKSVKAYLRKHGYEDASGPILVPIHHGYYELVVDDVVEKILHPKPNGSMAQDDDEATYPDTFEHIMDDWHS